MSENVKSLIDFVADYVINQIMLSKYTSLKEIDKKEIAIDLSVSKITVDTAFYSLCNKGVLIEKGNRYFVTDDENRLYQLKREFGKNLVHNFVSEFLNLGYQDFELLSFIIEEGIDINNVPRG